MIRFNDDKDLPAPTSLSLLKHIIIVQIPTPPAVHLQMK